jgi:acetoin:2,6-dichlorophenolindophenol oxidoreductase subunit beta
MTRMSYLGAIGAAQREAMEADERVVIIGEDVEANVYGTTGGKSRSEKGDFLQMFGPTGSATPRSPRRSSSARPSGRR